MERAIAQTPRGCGNCAGKRAGTLGTQGDVEFDVDDLLPVHVVLDPHRLRAAEVEEGHQPV